MKYCNTYANAKVTLAPGLTVAAFEDVIATCTTAANDRGGAELSGLLRNSVNLVILVQNKTGQGGHADIGVGETNNSAEYQLSSPPLS